jgi:hypothetical protein
MNGREHRFLDTNKADPIERSPAPENTVSTVARREMTIELKKGLPLKLELVNSSTKVFSVIRLGNRVGGQARKAAEGEKRSERRQLPPLLKLHRNFQVLGSARASAGSRLLNTTSLTSASDWTAGSGSHLAAAFRLSATRKRWTMACSC